MSEDSTALANISHAKQALEQTRDLITIIEIRSQAAALQAYATAKGADEVAHLGYDVKNDAERKAGQFIADMKAQDLLSKGGRPTENGNNVLPVLPTLRELGVEKVESQRWQKKAAIPDDKWNNYKIDSWKKAQKQNPAHVGNATGENEWYTPPDYVEAARLTMDKIDVDPASSDLANQIIKADKYFTIKEDGLKQEWHGNIWMNPPYSQPLIAKFCDLLVDKYLKKEIKQACVLVNNATETNFYQRMLRTCDAVCFIKGRIKFIDKNGNASGAPLQGQTILYFGEYFEAFSENFSYFGAVLYAKQ